MDTGDDLTHAVSILVGSIGATGHFDLSVVIGCALGVVLVSAGRRLSGLSQRVAPPPSPPSPPTVQDAIERHQRREYGNMRMIG